MRKLLVILALALVFCMGHAVTASATSPGLTLMAGGSYMSLPDTLESPGDGKIGYWGGALLQINSHVGVMGTYDYLQTDLTAGETTVSWSTFTVYVVPTLFEFSRGSVSGLAGVEWFDTNVSDFEYKGVDFTWGLMGVGKVGGPVGIFGSVTNTFMDGTELFDVLKARAGLTFTF